MLALRSVLNYFSSPESLLWLFLAVYATLVGAIEFELITHLSSQSGLGRLLENPTLMAIEAVVAALIHPIA